MLLLLLLGVTCLNVNVLELAYRVAELNELGQSFLDEEIGYSEPGLHVRLQVFACFWIVEFQGTNSSTGHEKVLRILNDSD
jgi:hypothetical protein